MMRRVAALLSVPLLLAIAGSALARQPPQRPPQPREREVTVANETDRALQELFVFRAGSAGEQGKDRLGGHVLPPRAALRVPLGRTAACVFGLRAVLEDGEVMRRRLDVCRSPRVTLAESGPRREVEVANDTDTDLRQLYLWPSGGRDPGPDRLGALIVPAGESARIRLRGTTAAACVLDLRAVFADGSEEARSRLDLCRNPRLGFGDPGLPVREVPVLNRARRAIRELYAVPRAGVEAAARQGGGWGQDRLGEAMLEPRATFRLGVRGRGCAFDLRAVYEDGREEVRRGLDLCVVQGVVFGERPSADAPPRRVTLVNLHRRAVRQAFLSPAEAEDWGEDALGGAALPGGARREVTMEEGGGCRADLRIVFDTGAAEERRGIDLCAIVAIVLRPGWTVEESLGGGIRLRNAAGEPVVALHADPPGTPRGVDRLGGAVLGPGEGLDLAPPADLPEDARCRADLTAVFRDGRELRLPALDLCAGEEVILR